MLTYAGACGWQVRVARGMQALPKSVERTTTLEVLSLLAYWYKSTRFTCFTGTKSTNTDAESAAGVAGEVAVRAGIAVAHS
jgi:hypothetical protein